jgi:hypothetical protein
MDPAAKAFNIVRFTPSSGDSGDGGSDASVAIELEEPWKHSAGLKPNINRATCSYLEFANLGATINATGSVQFFFSDDSDPDVSVDNITLIDAEPLRYGRTADDPDGPAIVVMYRLFFVDARYGFVAPRGGRLTLGLINPSDNQQLDPNLSYVPQPQTMQQLIQSCLDAMGIGDGVEVPSISVQAPNDLKWFGTHAPTELAKLLAMSNCVFVMQPGADDDQTPVYQIIPIGTGSTPTMPAGQALPTTTLSGVDARGKTVVFTSFPTQAAVTFDSNALDTGSDPSQPSDFTSSFRIVFPAKVGGAWVPIDNSNMFGSGTAIAEMNGGFTDIPNDPQSQYGCYRYLQLSPNLFDPKISPILRKTWPDPTGASATTSTNPWGLPPQIDIICRANVAVQDPTSGLWKNGSMVTVPLTAKVGDQNVFVSSARLVKLKSGVTSTNKLEANAVPLDFSQDIQLRFSLGDSIAATADSDQLVPAYFYVGFSGAAGSIAKLSGSDAQDAMTDPDTIVVPIAELQAVRFATTGWSDDGGPYNKAVLEDYCQALASRWLQDASKPPQIMPGVGFLPFTIDGVVGEVTIDQGQVITSFQVNAWFRPTGSYLASEYRRLVESAHESHPHEAKTQGKRTATSQSGSSQPMEPLAAYVAPSVVGMIYVSVNKDGGVAGSATTSCTFTYTVKTLGGGDLPDGANSTSTLKAPELNVRLPNVIYSGAGTGIAAYGGGSPPALHLLLVNEIPNSGAC